MVRIPPIASCVSTPIGAGAGAVGLMTGPPHVFTGYCGAVKVVVGVGVGTGAVVGVGVEPVTDGVCAALNGLTIACPLNLAVSGTKPCGPRPGCAPATAATLPESMFTMACGAVMRNDPPPAKAFGG